MSSSIRSQVFRVIDLETTGTDPARDAIIEIGWALMHGDGRVISSGSTLVNPKRPIPKSATDIHGITDSDVINAPDIEQALNAFPELVSPSLTAVSHNAKFDAAFIRNGSERLLAGNPRFLCTMLLCQNIFPGQENYKLGFLYEKTNFPHPKQGACHRAGYDVEMTARLFTHVIDKYLALGLPDDLGTFSSYSTMQRMPFGKHRGLPLNKVPKDYIGWLLDREIDDELRDVLLSVQNGTFKLIS